MSGLRPRALAWQTVWPAMAGAAQAASIAWPGSGQALGWLQVLSLMLLAAGLARLTQASFSRGREAHPLKRAAWFGGVFATAWLAGSFWWLYVSMHQVGGLPAPLAVLAVLALATALALYYAAASAVWVGLARGLVAERPGWASALFAAVWTLAELMRGRWLTGFPWGPGAMRMWMALWSPSRLGWGCTAWGLWPPGWPCASRWRAGACGRSSH